MKYATLKGMFYEDEDLYEKTYEKRFNSDSTYRFDFSTNENDVFVVILPQILTKIERILKLNDDLIKVVQNIPGIAIQQFELDCLKNEIIITNEIEGVILSELLGIKIPSIYRFIPIDFNLCVTLGATTKIGSYDQYC